MAINRVTVEHATNNWSLCVMAAGAADANTAHARPFTSKVSCTVTMIWWISRQAAEVVSRRITGAEAKTRSGLLSHFGVVLMS
jgi:hypothetical protein